MVGDAGSMSGMIEKTKVINLLLDLRNYVTIDIDCWIHDSAKQALLDVVAQIDEKLKEI